MKNENDIEKIIEQKSKELERIDVPPDLWTSIEAEIERLPKKRKISFQFLNEFFTLNKFRLGYASLGIILLVAAGLFFNSKKEIEIVQSKTEYVSKPLDNTTTMVQEVKQEKHVDKKIVRKLSREMKIASLEKKAERKIVKADEYERLVYQNKLTEIDEAIVECKKQYKLDFNELLKKNLAMVYDEKIKLLKDIISKN